jgi:hypothetical protein
VHDGECSQDHWRAEYMCEFVQPQKTPTRCLVLTQAQVVSRLMKPLLDGGTFIASGGLNATPLLTRWHAACGSPPRTAHEWGPLGYVGVHVPLVDMARLVEMCSVPGIVDAIVSMQSRSSAAALVGIYDAFDKLERSMHHGVLADALLERGHWLGEPLALWLNGKKHRVDAATRFTLACPAELHEYILQGNVADYAPEGRWSRVASLVRESYVPTMQGVEVAARVDAVLRHVHQRPCHFTVTLRNDRTWLVGVPYVTTLGGGLERQVLALPTC